MSTINVPLDYLTINDAIIASSSGDTIIVAVGTYNEQIFINKPNLTLLGAQSNIDARTRDYIPANESIITFGSLTIGTGILNFSEPDIILNGFTIEGIGTPLGSTSAIFGADLGTYPPSTSTIDLTGLQIINNIIKDNANGVLLASIEPFAKSPNYLIQHNYFLNNTIDGIYFDDNSLFTINQNIFDTSGYINISNGSNTNITGNIINQGDHIEINNSSDVLIEDNVIYQGTNGIFIKSGTLTTTLNNNLIYDVTNNGIVIHDGNDDVVITNNSIMNSTNEGIKISHDTLPNTNITINNNNIITSSTRILLEPDSYTGIMDVTNNYYGADPRTGGVIEDDNIPSVDSVTILPFLSSENKDSGPLELIRIQTV